MKAVAEVRNVEGILEIDTNRGVLYFHSKETGHTVLRVCQLDKDQLAGVVRQLDRGMSIDITPMFGVSYSWQEETPQVEAVPDHTDKLIAAENLRIGDVLLLPFGKEAIVEVVQLRGRAVTIRYSQVVAGEQVRGASRVDRGYEWHVRRAVSS